MDGRAVQIAQCSEASDPLVAPGLPFLRRVKPRRATSCSGPWIRYDPGFRHRVEMSAGGEAWLSIVRAQQTMLALVQHLGR